MHRKLISLVGVLLLVMGLSVYSYPKYQVYSQSIDRREEINHFVEKKQSDYIAILEIPKINLQLGLYAINDSRNNINQNIAFLRTSDMPDVTLGNTIIVGHSGNSTNSYFNDLYKLQLADIVYIYYNSIKYQYSISNIYKVDKTGYINLDKEDNQTTITLITCTGSNEQLVIIGNLIKEEVY